MPNVRKKGLKRTSFWLIGEEERVLRSFADREFGGNKTQAFREILGRGFRQAGSGTSSGDKKGRRKMTFWIDDKEQAMLDSLAAEYGVNMTDVLRTLLLVQFWSGEEDVKTKEERDEKKMTGGDK